MKDTRGSAAFEKQAHLIATRQADGFTLLELMVVLAIMVTLAGMVVPSVATALRSTGLKTTAHKLHELLNFARMSAVSRRRPVVVCLDSERRQCWVSLSTVTLPWLDEPEEPKTRTLASMTLPEGTEMVLLRGGEMALDVSSLQAGELITFRSDGVSEDVLIELTDQRDDYFEIEIVGATGQVLLREGTEQ